MRLVHCVLVVNFCEHQRYDIQQDAEVVRFMAITDRGTFHLETPCPRGKDRRERRKEFQDYVLNAMQQGLSPHEVSL